jgi:hypothetical protein
VTGVAIVSLYFLALTAFLGLDLLGKVPARMHALALAVLGTLTAVIALGALRATQATAAPKLMTGLGLAALALGAVAAGAGLGAIGRIIQPFLRPLVRKRPSS